MSSVVPAAESCCTGESWCALTCTSQVLSRKWHTIIVHRLLVEQPLGFAALSDRIEGISAKVLTESLDDLIANGLVEKEIEQERPKRVAYRLTEPGEGLEPVIEAMAVWGRRFLGARGPWPRAERSR